MCCPDDGGTTRPVSDEDAIPSLTLDDLIREVRETPGLRQLAWAEEEIAAAQDRHGEEGHGPIWSAFRLLMPTHDRMSLEAVYRAHCRELLDRVAAGADTRPPTAAEMIPALAAASQVAPLNPGAATLYFRLDAKVFPRLFDEQGVIDVAAYEKVHGREADDYEAWLREKLAQPWRTPGRTDADSTEG
jgi:hypothetical protein